MKRLSIFALLSLPLAAQDVPHKRLYRWSVVALTAASAADVASSWGKQELNPVLGRGTFGARQTGIKISISAGMLTAQWWAMLRHPELRHGFARSNFIAAGALGGVAVGNRLNWGRR
jgi:hypothetical protein